MDFTSESEDEIIREAVSQKLYIPLVNTTNKVCRYSSQTKVPTSPLHIGDILRYTNEGHNEMVYLMDVNKNDPDIIRYIIKFLKGNKMVVTKEFLNSINVPYIGSIPMYLEDYINELKNLTQEQIENTMFP